MGVLGQASLASSVSLENSLSLETQEWYLSSNFKCKYCVCVCVFISYVGLTLEIQGEFYAR